MFTQEIKLIPPEQLKAELSLTEAEKRLRERKIREVESVLSGESGKLLLITGPCSAHEKKSVLEYVEKLRKLAEKVEDKFLIIPRVFTSKPRTKGLGYKGMIPNPDLLEKEDFSRGLRAARDLHLAVFRETEFIAADEMLFPEEFEYIEDLVGYTVIGARTSESPLHRMAASALAVPVGVKNPMSGSLPALAHSVEAIQREQCYFRGGCQVRTSGNPFSHGILRGRVNEQGTDEPNWGKKSVMALLEAFSALKVQNSAALVDCNHSNSAKRPEDQPGIAREILKMRREDRAIAEFLRGIMIESFLKGGADPSGKEYGMSVTDPCLGFRETEKLILSLADEL